MKKLVLASANTGKLRELQALLADLGIEVLAQGALGVPEVEETGASFAENALLKARHAARHTGLPAMGDDSGLVVDALGGAPGIYSARYAGHHGDNAANIRKLLHELRDVPPEQRGAHFHCAMACVRTADDPAPLVCEATWEGCILHAARGHGGFGYDPVFLIAGETCSAAELKPEEKNLLSHRGQALRKLVAQLRTWPER
ncbi:MAG: RdgB/HAM1 family non-canonical purine NTP pyrophosphatase [Gammaproteobacteria bacterium]|nr:RdgB/HAM1 family non-canonical purine NTP pyrophosphatase [Gammaproteobacteria bacterium]